ncbi:MAG: peptidoglycan DD-metalloendopeptidase family protein [Candidatus Omnitrophica bacterium]|nr:peptidoglycan DD-metalloendopeptidase family protein [Candidatus Omnitrophota bacterium]
MNNHFKFLFFSLLIFISGCTATTEYDYGYVPSQDKTESVQDGIYHKVKPGDSIWRIAETYNVSVDEVVESNKIPDVAKIETNQLVFIPGAVIEKEFILSTPQDEEFYWPVTGRVIKYFNVQQGREINQGIDIKAKAGEFVKASRSGTVVFADYLTGYGNTLILDHQDDFYTVYSKNSKLLVRLGDVVKRNDPISEVDKNENLAFLHFQIRKNAKEENPLFYLP